MKLLKLHSRATSIIYKNSLCSFAFFLVFLIALASVAVPLFLVTVLSPYSGIAESRILFEQPKVEFQHKYLFIAETSGGDLIACSTFGYFNERTQDIQSCSRIKYWEDDWNYDFKIDKSHIKLDLDLREGMHLKHFYLILFFKGKLTHKCTIKPPTILILEHYIASSEITSNAEIKIKGNLDLIQNSQFLCPFYGRSTKSHFRTDILPINSTAMSDFNIEKLRKQITDNPGYFILRSDESYYKKRSSGGVTISLEINFFEVGGRYRLSIWEKLGQFWLYFASFFGISFYISSKIKDIIFNRRLVRSWEIIPWKKAY